MLLLVNRSLQFVFNLSGDCHSLCGFLLFFFLFLSAQWCALCMSDSWQVKVLLLHLFDCQAKGRGKNTFQETSRGSKQTSVFLILLQTWVSSLLVVCLSASSLAREGGAGWEKGWKETTTASVIRETRREKEHKIFNIPSQLFLLFLVVVVEELEGLLQDFSLIPRRGDCSCYFWIKKFVLK